jgi:nitrogen PTS system EIIA component
VEQPDIMTLEEVAQYLRVSERTIYDWAQKGDLPGGKIGTVWRFRRADIDKWLDGKLGQGGPRSDAVDLSALLDAERVLFIDSQSKSDVLNVLVGNLAQSPAVRDPGGLLAGVLRREEMMSTGIGLGVAVPHVRLDTVDEVVMAVARSTTDISDYESVDGQPIRMVFMIAAGADQHKEYLRVLSGLTRLVREEPIREKLLRAEDPQLFVEALRDN